jgi:hypothetical protein
LNEEDSDLTASTGVMDRWKNPWGSEIAQQVRKIIGSFGNMYKM